MDMQQADQRLHHALQQNQAKEPALETRVAGHREPRQHGNRKQEQRPGIDHDFGHARTRPVQPGPDARCPQHGT